jgi:hypothetical protein
VNHRLLLGAGAIAISVLTPLAARADTGPCGTDVGAPLPDLVVDVAKIRQSLTVTEEKFAKASCATQEGFVSGPGPHTLLRFATSTANVGAGALVIGDPAACPGLFEFSPCHGHYHFDDYAVYRLWTPEGYDIWLARRDLSQPTSTGVNAATLEQAQKDRALVVGRKMGFCMIDNDPYLGLGSPVPTYTSCLTTQGISIGWADNYGAFLDGQYLQIDSLKTGDYVLEMHANPDHLLPESDYLNNSVAVRVRFTQRRGQTAASIEVLP